MESNKSVALSAALLIFSDGAIHIFSTAGFYCNGLAENHSFNAIMKRLGSLKSMLHLLISHVIRVNNKPGTAYAIKHHSDLNDVRMGEYGSSEAFSASH